MRRWVALVAAAALVLLAGWTPVSVGAQTVRGSLVDDAEGAPIVGVSVLLLDEGAVETTRTVTDARGGFELEAPRPGVYMVVVEREGFANTLTDPFTLADGEEHTLNLTLRMQRVGETGVTVDTLQGAALLAQAIADACAGRFVPSMHGIVFGAVRDEATGQPLPEAQVRLTWKPVDAAGVADSEATVRADDAGAYLVCTLPAGREVRLAPSVSEVEGSERSVTLRAGLMDRVDLTIPLSNPNEPGNLLGRVVDFETGQPLAGAEVRLREAGRSMVTNTRGVFILRDVPPGLDVLEVELIGYATTEKAVQVAGGRALQVDVRLPTEAVELAPILVSVRPRSWFMDRADLENRIDLGNGIILTRAELDERGPSFLGDALRGLPGVRVTRSGGGVSADYTVRLRGAANLSSQACNPMVWVDGRRWGNDGSAFGQILGHELDVVEIYRGPAEVPGEFSGGDARCGVIVVWTLRGARRR